MEVLTLKARPRNDFRWTHRPARWTRLLLLTLAGVAQVLAQSGATAEYRLKAVFLFNFAQFVEWPPAAFATPDAPLVIGVLGEDPFGLILDETVRAEKVGLRPLVVERYRRIEEITSCHILFISHSENRQLEAILAKLKGRGILTVADFEGSAQRGVMIRFMTENRKIRLRINLESARAVELTISSKLLRPAQIVGPDDD